MYPQDATETEVLPTSSLNQLGGGGGWTSGKGMGSQEVVESLQSLGVVVWSSVLTITAQDGKHEAADTPTVGKIAFQKGVLDTRQQQVHGADRGNNCPK